MYSYIDILCRLSDAVTGKRPEKCRNNCRFLLHNAPAHQPGLVKDFLDKNNVTTLEYPSNSSGWATANFDLFPPLIFSLKGRVFCDTTNIIKNVWVEMKSLSQNGFQELFPTNLQSLGSVYSFTRGLFSKKYTLNNCTLTYFSEIK